MNVSDLKKSAVVAGKRAANLFSRYKPWHGARSSPPDAQASHGITDQFHLLWTSSAGAATVTWLGQPILKNPLDMWIYQEVMYRARPDIIIETGTHRGGSALFFATMGRMMELPLDVLTIDINPKLAFDPRPWGICSIRGISTHSATLRSVREFIVHKAGRLKSPPRVMVVLDSDHSEKNVSDELEEYAPLVTEEQYLVVEDTNVNGNPVLPEHGPGPLEAVRKFLAGNAAFIADPFCERFLFTFNPGGWLRRRAT